MTSPPLGVARRRIVAVAASCLLVAAGAALAPAQARGARTAEAVTAAPVETEPGTSREKEPQPAPARPAGGVTPGATPDTGAPTDAPAEAPRAGGRPEDGTSFPAGANDWACVPSAAHPRPLVLVHGLGATAAENWFYLGPLLHEAGYCVFALTYGESPERPDFGGILPMQESAKELDDFVDRVLAATGAAQIDLLGHSEGTVMPQWWLKKLGGAALTHRYVAMTPLYDGTTVFIVDPVVDTLKALFAEGAGQATAGFDGYCGSCQQLLNGSDFYDELYADGTVGAPGVLYTTIMSRYDELVVPYTSGHIVAPGATNIVVQDVCPLNLDEHVLVAFDPVVARMILNALDPEHAAPVSCGPLLGLGAGPINL
jgi:pimeloyl-ACP methyl ester carboxylesterase